jgi:hypothetical protein
MIILLDQIIINMKVMLIINLINQFLLLQFQFVNFHEVMNNKRATHPEVEFARLALQEIPDQYRAIVQLQLL